MGVCASSNSSSHQYYSANWGVGGGGGGYLGLEQFEGGGSGFFLRKVPRPVPVTN